MKIEMGESLLYSWLRHVKGCQITQTNWSPSASWELHNRDRLVEIMDKTSEYFSTKYGIEVFKKNLLDQLLKQAEIDVVGVSYSPEPYVYGVEVAFHEDGLNYGNKSITIASVIKKYVRAILCLIGYFDFSEGEVIFATPCANKSLLSELMPKIKELQNLLTELNVNYTIRFITEEQFYKAILSPIMLSSDNISDTAELFMRSYQMIKLFENKDKADKPTVSPKQENYLSISALDELKIGKVVQLTMSYMAENNRLSEDEVSRLTDKGYSKDTFNINFPMLKESSEEDDGQRFDKRGYTRYYSKSLCINGKQYLLCQEWNDRFSRKQYDEWYKSRIGIK